jgi:hypothetical protein
VSLLQRPTPSGVTPSDEGRIKQAAFNCAFDHLPGRASGDSPDENDTHVYCFVSREADQVCLMYAARIGDHLFPLSTYIKELSYLAGLSHRLLQATICQAIQAIVDHGEEQIIKKFTV